MKRRHILSRLQLDDESSPPGGPTIAEYNTLDRKILQTIIENMYLSRMGSPANGGTEGEVLYVS